MRQNIQHELYRIWTAFSWLDSDFGNVTTLQLLQGLRKVVEFDDIGHLKLTEYQA